jgi:hypothetical protein
MESSTYPDKKFIASSQNYVNVAVHTGTAHGTKELRVGRESKEVCKLYGNFNSFMTCAEHNSMRGARIPGADKVRGVPALIILDPTGEKVLHQSSGGKSASGLIKVFDDVIKENRLAPVPAFLYQKTKNIRAAAEAKLEEGKYKDAIRAYNMLAKTKGPRSIKDLAKNWMEEGLAKCDAIGQGMLDKVESLWESEEASDKKEAKKVLNDVYRNFKYLDSYKKAKEMKKRIK